jgi:signal transduction histidine kinase
MGRRNDELSDLGQNFDNMAIRLQNLLETQRRLLHDVSHEIRSPLARLQMATDLMQQEPSRAAELIPRLQRETERIDTLVGELLFLARLDSGMTEFVKENVDLCELVTSIAEDARFEADSKNCSVEIALPERLAISGNYELLYRAIENVVRNAIQHTPVNSRIKISLIQESTGLCTLKVADQGSGVSPSELENIFQAFFRSERETRKSGYGLGLAITQRVVQAHGGKVSARNVSPTGLEIAMSLTC